MLVGEVAPRYLRLHFNHYHSYFPTPSPPLPLAVMPADPPGTEGGTTDGIPPVNTSNNPDQSPYGVQFATTRAGFFSILLWRVITYSSAAAAEGYIKFDDLDDWRIV